ncbi:MAG TPA: precorrin-8X methylmutase [Arachnia sp.]|nr:precorrin-8X methylmutase [Arachnia sp.]HMT87264.1 precorrin-8X methylmutase [Arachnia sp.]
MDTRSYLADGSDIYRESFRIIREETDLDRFPDDVSRVVVRMVHAAGATDIADDVAFTPGVVRASNAALRAGAPIFCDSSMVATGIIRSRLPRDNDVVCHIKDPALAEIAAERGITKTMAAVDLWLPRLEGAVVAIGNAPTALFRLLEVIRETGVRPAAVVGIPVGFVGAAESKDALAANDLGLEYLVVRGRRGGSAMTVAAVNAIASTDELTNTSRQD